jgi:hypothetical protein
MAVHLRSITGKVDYEVEQVIRDLVLAFNQLEGRPLPAAVRGPTSRAEPQRAVVDRQAIGDLEGAVGTVTPLPTVPGVVGTQHLDLVVALDTVSPGLILTPQAFTQQIVLTLFNGGTIGSVTVAADANWGRRFNPSGILSNDTAAYLQPTGILNPFSVDIILGATGPDPVPAWNEMGRIGGEWRTP